MVFEDGHNDYSQAGFARSINVFYGKLIRLEVNCSFLLFTQ